MAVKKLKRTGGKVVEEEDAGGERRKEGTEAQ